MDNKLVKVKSDVTYFNDKSIINLIGDIVPYGSRMIYKNVCNFINTLALHPIYTLCGNHDTEYYQDYFGKVNYSLLSDNLLLVILDNSKRLFLEETLEFFKKTLAKYPRDNIVVMFHIPPPVKQTSNTINPGQWELVRDIYLPYKDKIRYFICGHVHSFVEDSVDNIPVIITGGGGARIEIVDNIISKNRINHHIVQLYFEDDILKYRYVNIDSVDYKVELEDKTLKEMLEVSFNKEVFAHFKYKYLSKKAIEQGRRGISKLFSALSDSEFYHAMNHYHVLDRAEELESAIKNSIAGEKWEIECMYKENFDYAKDKGHSLSQYTFNDARNAEIIHKKLLEKGEKILESSIDIPEQKYFTCSSCGYTFETDSSISRCPICGAPHDKIVKV